MDDGEVQNATKRDSFPCLFALSHTVTLRCGNVHVIVPLSLFSAKRNHGTWGDRKFLDEQKTNKTSFLAGNIRKC